MIVVPLPCLSDNYAYLAFETGSRDCVVIDPSDGQVVQSELRRRGLQATAVLCTHHHGDHVDGVEDLVSISPEVRVFAHERDKARTPKVTDAVGDGETVMAAGIAFRAMHVPGHTMGAVAWVAGDCAFTGDTLFLGGCGRIFEGTADMLYRSLNEGLAALPASTLVYCGHEYTASNLAFAASVEPANLRIRDRLEAVRAARQGSQPSVPGTIGQELETNPFLRCAEPGVVAYALAHGAESDDAVSVFAALRRAKNVFRG